MVASSVSLELSNVSDLPIAFRPGKPEDYQFILQTWLHDYWKVPPFNFIPKDIYIPKQSQVIDTLLANSNITIMCLDEDEDFIIGYLIWEPFNDSNIIVHWGNVKGPHRDRGRMKLILDHIQLQDKAIVCSHFFKLFPTLRNDHKYKLIYDPTLLDGIQ